MRVPRGVARISCSSYGVWMRPERRFFASRSTRRRRRAYGSLPAVPLETFGRGGSLANGSVSRVLEKAHAERPERRLGRVAHEAARLVAIVAMAMPAPRRNVNRVPCLPVVADAVDLGPSASFDHEENRVPRVAMDRGRRSGIDLVDERVESARGPIAVPSHVDAGAQAARGRRQRDVLLADDRLAVFAPLVDELGAAFLLNVVVRRRGLCFGGHRTRGRLNIHRDAHTRQSSGRALLVLPAVLLAQAPADRVERAQARRDAGALHVARADRVAAARRRVREEIRRQGAALARAVGGSRAARHHRSQGTALFRGRRRDQRSRDGDDRAREAARRVFRRHISPTCRPTPFRRTARGFRIA